MSGPLIGKIHVCTNNNDPLNQEYEVIYPETSTSQIVDFEYGVNYVLINNMPKILSNNKIVVKELELENGLVSNRDNIVNGFIKNAAKDINDNDIVDTYATKNELQTLREENIQLRNIIESLELRIEQLENK